MLFAIGFLTFLAASITNAVLVVFSDVSLMDYISLSDFGLFREVFIMNPVAASIVLIAAIIGGGLMFTAIVKER